MHDPYRHGYPPGGHPPMHPYGHGPWMGGYPPGPHPPVQATQATGSAPPTAAPPAGMSHSRFLKGALFGALAAYLLTNETVQQNAIKAAVRAWSMVQGGVEEMKERFRDAEAELHAAQAVEDEE